MKFKTIFTCIIAIQMAACQQSDDIEAGPPNDATTTEIEQLTPVSDYTDLVNLPTSATYVKEQSLKGENTSPYGYVVRRPEGFGSDGLKYPVLIYLHGVGSKGNSNTNPADINKVDKDGAIRAIKLGLWKPKVTIPVFAPQSSTSWNASNVKSFINYLINTYPNAINTNRIYLSGFSMGAMGTWTYLDKYGYENSLIAAAVTMAGAKDECKVEALKLMPFWAFHGQKDGTVPANKTINLVDSFRAQYPSQEHQKLTLFTQDDFEGKYHRIDHGVYDRTFWDKNHTGDVFKMDVMNWMLQYKRNN
jgi:predicted peptidase